MIKIYIAAGVIGALVLGGGALFIISDGDNTGSSSLQKLSEIVSGKENSDVCEYGVDISGITLVIRNGEGVGAVDTGFSTKQISDAIVPATWTATTTAKGTEVVPVADKQIKFRFTSEGEQMFAEITGRIAENGGTLTLYINNNLVSTSRVMSKITGRDLLMNLSGSDKSVEQIVGAQNLKLNCPKYQPVPATSQSSIKATPVSQTSVQQLSIKINGQQEADITYPQNTIMLSWEIPNGWTCTLSGYLGDSSKSTESRPVSAGSAQMEIQLLDLSTRYGLYAERAIYGLSCENGSVTKAILNLKQWPK